MKTPSFWYQENTLSDTVWPVLLTPLSKIYYYFAKEFAKRPNPYKPKAPVICIGNLVAGGAGKTPVVIALAQYLKSKGKNPHVISRGYGRTTKGLIKVDGEKHNADQVGDEPLLIAKQDIPCWVCNSRGKSAHEACKAGADVIIMDDGHQNFDLVKTLSLVVVDGLVGFGNRRLIPAGPLREPVKEGLSRADGLIIIGDDLTGIGNATQKPVIQAHNIPTDDRLAGTRVFAFAGLGRPEKFLRTLYLMNANITDFVSFPDHYPYNNIDIDELIRQARKQDAVAVTTRKDIMRIPERYHSEIEVLDVELSWDEGEMEKLDTILSPILK